MSAFGKPILQNVTIYQILNYSRLECVCLTYYKESKVKLKYAKLLFFFQTSYSSSSDFVSRKSNGSAWFSTRRCTNHWDRRNRYGNIKISFVTKLFRKISISEMPRLKFYREITFFGVINTETSTPMVYTITIWSYSQPYAYDKSENCNNDNDYCYSPQGLEP